MSYEIFSQKAARRTNDPTVRISSHGRLGLNKAATSILSADAIEQVLLLWDKERRRIAIRPIKKKDIRSFRVTFSKNAAGAGIAAKSFCDYIGYDYAKTKIFPAKWNDSESALEFELWADEEDNKDVKKFEVHKRQQSRSA